MMKGGGREEAKEGKGEREGGERSSWRRKERRRELNLQHQRHLVVVPLSIEAKGRNRGRGE